MEYIISIVLSLLIVKYVADFIIYYKAWRIEENGIKLASDRDSGLSIDKETGKSVSTERAVLRP